MGYTTDFSGSFQFDRPLTVKEKEYINTFSETRRMKRDVNKLMKLYKGKHGNPFAAEKTPEAIYGREGEYFAKNDGNCGQTHDDSIIEYNCPPGQAPYDEISSFDEKWDDNQIRIKNGICQPGLWCQWIATNDGESLEWNGGEKFYDYVDWLKYLIEHFFSKWGIKLNGEVEWFGEDSDDRGLIIVKDNVVKTKIARITYEDAD